jgi:hypothetical protein
MLTFREVTYLSNRFFVFYMDLWAQDGDAFAENVKLFLVLWFLSWRLATSIGSDSSISNSLCFLKRLSAKKLTIHGQCGLCKKNVIAFIFV